ncbi:hypothetical protein [Microbulbifer sp. ALW1]|uniref:hypothetical protein n=1 Tax=Microbulbifer sp. (strain ALW1) TaxID=1516059 RepID=UPI0013598DF6|nr:hypothetical protein [Microbulbifer sp. ALW1]
MIELIKFLTDAFKEILFSELNLSIVLCITFLEGLSHWIKLVRTDENQKLPLALEIPYFAGLTYFISSQQLQVFIAAIIFIRFGKFAIAPIMDLFWNYYHYGNSLKSFSLSKDNPLGPSQRLKIKQSVSKKYFSLRFTLPKRNTKPRRENEWYWSGHKEEIYISKALQETISVRTIRKYNWDSQISRGYFNEESQQNYCPTLIISEIDFYNKGALRSKDDINRIVSELVINEFPPDRVSNGELSLSLIDSSIDIGISKENNFSHIHLAIQSWATVSYLRVITIPMKNRKYIVFSMFNYLTDGDYIFRCLMKKLEIFPSPPKANFDLTAYKPNMAELNALTRKIATIHSERFDRCQHLKSLRDMNFFRPARKSRKTECAL